MYVPTSRRSVESPRGRRNLTRTQRAALVAPLLELQKQQDGRLQGWQVAAIARQHNRDERSIRRDLAELGKPGPTRAPWRPPRELLVRAAMYDGNIQKAHRELLAFVDGPMAQADTETRFNHFVFGDLNCREWATF